MLKKLLKNDGTRFLLSAVVVLIISLSLRTYTNPVMIAGNSMYPTLKNHQIRFTRLVRDDTEIERFMIVGTDTSRVGQRIIKRVIGLPGDVIVIEEGLVTINGEPYETYEPLHLMDRPYEGTTVLGEDEYFLLGDNVNNSVDSRVLGPVHRSELERILR